MNRYIDLKRIEFPVTNACTGKCEHCSEGYDRYGKIYYMDKKSASDAVESLSEIYNIESVMTFGGEPLVNVNTVYAIHEKARERGIPKRQIISNGYFTNDTEEIKRVAERLCACGINSFLLSVDAFHQRTIPIDRVYLFAEALKANGIEGLKLHPAWLGGRENRNPYNDETEKCLDYFAPLNLPVSKGNNVFPAGNAEKNFPDYFEKKPVDIDVPCGAAPYTERLDNVGCVSVDAGGDVIICCFPIGNIHEENIRDILERYNPYTDRYLTALMKSGVRGLLSEALKDGIAVDTGKYRSACGICREIMKKHYKSR